MSLFDSIFSFAAAPVLNDFNGDKGLYDYREPDGTVHKGLLMIRMNDTDEESFGDDGTVWEHVTTFVIPKDPSECGISTINRDAMIVSSTEEWNITRIALDTTTYTQVEATRVRSSEFTREGLRQ